MWTEKSKRGKGKKKALSSGNGGNRDRFISKMFLRGDAVVLIVFSQSASEE